MNRLDFFKRYLEENFNVRPTLTKLSQLTGLSKSYLSQILSGKRPLGNKQVDRLSKALNIDPVSFKTLKDLDIIASTKEKKLKFFEPVKALNSLSLLEEWYYIPLLELMHGYEEKKATQWYADELGLDPESVDVAIHKLITSGFIEHQPDGRYRKSKPLFRLQTKDSLSAIRKFHSKMIHKAQEELLKDTQVHPNAYKRRLITGLTITIPPSKIQEAKNKLENLLYQLGAELTEKDESPEVYQLNLQFFPLRTRQS